jgi:hypothetical protein
MELRGSKVRNMSLWPVLLRVLLSVALILNGSAYAVASAHLSNAFAVPQQHPLAHERMNQSLCHDDQAATLATHEHDAMEHEPGSPESPSHPDCCESGACRCVCTQAATVAVAMVFARDALIARSNPSRPLKPGRPAPALRHLIRPPIG